MMTNLKTTGKILTIKTATTLMTKKDTNSQNIGDVTADASTKENATITATIDQTKDAVVVSIS